MGKILTKCSNCCCCCCCCCDCSKLTNNRIVPVQRKYKVLLLGLSGSGKTDLGYYLSGKTKRTDYAATNGVQYYRMPMQHIIPDTDRSRHMGLDGVEEFLAITEIGGNAEMQKLWQQYFLTAMAIIYCLDITAEPEMLQHSLNTLKCIAEHEHIRGKPILVVATKWNLMNEANAHGLQLYDLENAFNLDTLAQATTCRLRMSYYEGLAEMQRLHKHTTMNSLNDAIKWLTTYLRDKHIVLAERIRRDECRKAWQLRCQRIERNRNFEEHYKYPTKPKNLGRRKIWRLSGRFRPKTAPSTVYSISTESGVSSVKETTIAATINASSNLVPKSIFPSDDKPPIRQNGHAIAI